MKQSKPDPEGWSMTGMEGDRPGLEFRSMRAEEDVPPSQLEVENRSHAVAYARRPPGATSSSALVLCQRWMELLHVLNILHCSPPPASFPWFPPPHAALSPKTYFSEPKAGQRDITQLYRHDQAKASLPEEEAFPLPLRVPLTKDQKEPWRHFSEEHTKNAGEGGWMKASETPSQRQGGASVSGGSERSGVGAGGVGAGGGGGGEGGDAS